MNDSIPISVCTLCLNEAENLPRCLKYSHHFDEWIVLDTGSTDDSVNIAKNLGARVETSPWLGFSATRRYHFSLAKNSWILWIDADEEVTPSLVDELRALSPKLDKHSAYEINRLMYFEGRWIRHGDWFPDWVTRLFNINHCTMPQRDIHESLEVSGSTGKIHNTLPHYSYLDWEDRKRRVESYTSLWAQQQINAGKATSFSEPAVRAIWKLFRGVILKGGFLDGTLGLKIAWSNAHEVFKKYQKLRHQSH